MGFFFISEPYPESCVSSCRCYSDSDEKTLVADCTGLGLTDLPQSLPLSIDCLYLSRNKISSFHNNATTFRQLTKLNLSSNTIDELSNAFLNWLLEDSQLTSLDISKNKLTTLPPGIKGVTSSLNELWISGNRFKCLCDHIWIKDWLVNNSGTVKDFNDVKCQMKSGKWIPMIEMHEENLGCVFRFPLWTISSK